MSGPKADTPGRETGPDEDTGWTSGTESRSSRKLFQERPTSMSDPRRTGRPPVGDLFVSDTRTKDVPPFVPGSTPRDETLTFTRNFGP